ncbi:hypothetical protein JR316_0000278 [Psilocybe cubensis]|uniref:Uncharacterized protein n=1 Tax=Psilocybe cubensis TaxID=181762 RepID=A0ACB8HGC2_PSICU|nr:hypothetical protein JR316_0000278 [Psilocybe cubensis]KAH9486214.1 hypothetical protein JR316_0000278 [Psilocybe cubensis]
MTPLGAYPLPRLACLLVYSVYRDQDPAFLIHTASGTISGSKRRYNHIVSVIVESNAVYSLVLLVEAIITVVPGFSIIESPAWPVSEFIDTILFTVTGLIPTVMIARLALTSSENSDSSGIITHVSALDFSPDKGSTRNVDALSASGEIMNSSHSVHGKSQHEILMIGSEKKPDDSQV